MDSDKYLHSNVENKIYTYWEKNNLFKPIKNKRLHLKMKQNLLHQ